MTELTARQFAQAQTTPGRWQEQVETWLRRGGWKYIHIYDARKSNPGFPDILAIRGSRGLVAELKCGSARLSATQRPWLAAFAAAGWEAYEWRPEQGDQIRELLTSGAHGFGRGDSIDNRPPTARKTPPRKRQGLQPARKGPFPRARQNRF